MSYDYQNNSFFLLNVSHLRDKLACSSRAVRTARHYTRAGGEYAVKLQGSLATRYQHQCRNMLIS